jgi:hypothetical protein
MATKKRGTLPLLAADENAGGEKGRAPGERRRRSLEEEVAYNRSDRGSVECIALEMTKFLILLCMVFAACLAIAADRSWLVSGHCHLLRRR